MRLECEHQTIPDFSASLSMNIWELFGILSSGGVNASEVSSNIVKNLRAVDDSGSAIYFEYSELYALSSSSNFHTPQKKIKLVLAF